MSLAASLSTVDMRVHDELEALEAILIENLKVKDEDGMVVETMVHPSTADKLDQRYVCLKLEVKLTPDYPESSPQVFLRNPRGLDDEILSSINSKIQEKLDRHVGNPILFELIEIVREFLTQCNLPSGQCVICLHSFVTGDIFVKTPCYHHFHSHCLAKHLINGSKYHQEEIDKLPKWQQLQAKPYVQNCPVCRSETKFDVSQLEEAPPPIESENEPPFRLTEELKERQRQMAEILARQVARGGVVGSGDDGPPLLTISSPTDNEQPSASTSASSPKKSEPAPSTSNASAAYNGPFRGFNRRAKPGKRGRGGAR